MTADSKCGFYVIYYQRMRWLLIVPRFQEPQNLKNSGCRCWTDFSRSWVLRGAVPLIRSAVWRIRTSKSFPTDWLATSSNTIMGIRHVMAQFLDTQLTNSTLRLPEGVVPSKWSWWSEIRTHEPEGTDLQSACFVHLHIHQCDGVLPKLPSFMCLEPTKAR